MFWFLLLDPRKSILILIKGGINVVCSKLVRVIDLYDLNKEIEFTNGEEVYSQFIITESFSVQNALTNFFSDYVWEGEVENGSIN